MSAPFETRAAPVPEHSPEQTRAARRSGQDVCVVAGPGSGKTSVLIERFRWLVENEGVSPHRVLAITFTEKAAAEIRQRLSARFEDSPAMRQSVARAWVSTIHGFCARLLRDHAAAAGVDPAFTVLDATRADVLLRQAAGQALDDLLVARPGETRALLEAIYSRPESSERQENLAGSLAAIHDASRITGPLRVPLPPAALPDAIAGMLRRAIGEMPSGTPAQRAAHEDFRAWARRFLEIGRRPPERAHFDVLAAFPGTRLKPGTLARDAAKAFKDGLLQQVRSHWLGAYYGGLGEVLAQVLDDIDRRYRLRKRELGALDFADLEIFAIELLSDDPATHALVRDGFEHVLMDELQDTNPVQWKLVDLVRRPGRFFAVGDINQSIYGFRHAAPEIFARYRGGLVAGGLEIDELRENHRSRPEILRAVEAILGQAQGIEPHRFHAARECPPIDAPCVELIAGLGADTAQAAAVEARWVARRIGELAQSTGLGDIAVLGRSAPALEAVQEALDEAGIPWLAGGGRTFYVSREVRDLTALLCTIADPADELSLATALRSPLAGIDDETLLAWAIDDGLAAGVAPGGFQARLDLAREIRDEASPDRLVAPFVDAAGYEGALSPRGRANVEKFLWTLREWHEREPRPLEAVLGEIRERRAAEMEPEAPPVDPHAVRLMTIHQAKGLQFPVVFLAALHRGVDRRKPALLLSRGGALGVRWRDPAAGGGCGDPAYLAAEEESDAREEAEENRLLYVAMTRARDRLVLSFAHTPRPQSGWPALIARGLGIDPQAVQPESYRHMSPDGVPVLVTVSDRSPALSPRAADVRDAGEGLLWLDAAEPGDQQDGSATVTSIAEFSACPRRYYLDRYLRQAAPAVARIDEDVPEREPGPDGAEFGTLVHRLLAGAPAEVGDAAAAELADRFRQSELGRRAARADRIEREFEFMVSVEDLVLRGQIDLWFEEGGERVLVDYKTDREAAEATPGYQIQLRLYALALSRLDGRVPDRAVLVYLRTGEMVEVSLAEDVMAAVRAFQAAQSEVVFPLREGAQCLRCPFYLGLCPASAIATTWPRVR
ncbi:MAG: UvrD-helicase domain-containing protein [Bryobacteraceae bacterium]